VFKPIVIVRAEDFGGGFALPHYGIKRPSADYYNLNLMMHNFVISDITSNQNFVMFYDERDGDKGADALCSMRLAFNLKQLAAYRKINHKPTALFGIYDNCVGQNKSQVVMKFNIMLSVLFYERTVANYLVSGHTHMIPDRVVSWWKRHVKNVNLYTLEDIVRCANEVGRISAQLLKRTSDERPFRVGWGALLNKHFNDLPSGYTFNHFFEFFGGNCYMRHLESSPVSEMTVIRMFSNTPAARKALCQDLFGTDTVEGASFEELKLPSHGGNRLTQKKLKSLNEKYFSIPGEYISFYPVYDPALDPPSVASGSGDAAVPPKTRKRTQHEKKVPGLQAGPAKPSKKPKPADEEKEKEDKPEKKKLSGGRPKSQKTKDKEAAQEKLKSSFQSISKFMVAKPGKAVVQP